MNHRKTCVAFFVVVAVIILIRLYAANHISRVPLPAGYGKARIGPRHIAFYSVSGQRADCVIFLASSNPNQAIDHETRRDETIFRCRFTLDGGEVIVVSASSQNQFIEIDGQQYAYGEGRVFLCPGGGDVRQFNIKIPDRIPHRDGSGPIPVENLVAEHEEIRNIIIEGREQPVSPREW